MTAAAGSLQPHGNWRLPTVMDMSATQTRRSRAERQACYQITPAVRFEVLSGVARAAPTRSETYVLRATATEAARMLQQENLAALRWLSDRGRSRLADRVVPEPHTFIEVDAIDALEVVKACQAAAFVCAASPGWSGSAAHRLVTAVCTAATHRLDGYADAPWMWTRPTVRSGAPMALGRLWRPELPGVQWVAVQELSCAWDAAALVLVTVPAVADLPAGMPARGGLPAGMPARGGLFLLAGDDSADEVWEAVAAVSPEAVLYWPACEAWLAEQVRHPSPEYTHHRQSRP